jgi:hypothetical protein
MISALPEHELVDYQQLIDTVGRRSKKKRVGGVKKPLNTLAECLSVHPTGSGKRVPHGRIYGSASFRAGAGSVSAQQTL